MDLTMLRQDSPQGLMQLIRRMFLEINTAIPGQIVSFDPSKQMATVQSCIRGTLIGQNGEKSFIDPPPIDNVPVLFPFSTTTGFSVTYPVKSGDQCLLIFSQRSFDKWFANGGVQNPSEKVSARSHNYSDALAIVGLAPIPFSVKNFQEAGNGACLFDGIELRNKDRNSYVKVMDQQVRIHEGKADILLQNDGTVNISVSSAPAPNDTAQEIAAVSSIKISPSGTVDIKGSTVNVQCTQAEVVGNAHVTGNLRVEGTAFAKAFTVIP